MIVHVFTGSRYHLVPGISKGIAVTYTNQEHFFVLYGDDSIDKNKYIELYSSIGFPSYCFCTTKKQLFKVLSEHKRNAIVFHEGSYIDFSIAFMAGCKNVSWVCWGSGAVINNNIKSKLITPVKRLLYRHFKYIVVLMTPDKNSLIRDFGVNEDSVAVIPYSSSLAYKSMEQSELIRVKNIDRLNAKPRILLGNNPGNIPYYISMLHQLKKFAGKIEIHCMCQYSLVKDDKYCELQRLGKSFFNEDFFIDEQFMNNAQYNEYLSGFDVYICGNKAQTGLGAIKFCSRLGKKIFITGKNLEWIRSYFGTIVFDADTIDNISYDDFIKPLTEEEKSFNINASRSKVEENIFLWNEWFNKID